MNIDKPESDDGLYPHSLGDARPVRTSEIPAPSVALSYLAPPERSSLKVTVLALVAALGLGALAFGARRLAFSA